MLSLHFSAPVLFLFTEQFRVKTAQSLQIEFSQLTYENPLSKSALLPLSYSFKLTNSLKRAFWGSGFRSARQRLLYLNNIYLFAFRDTKVFSSFAS